MNIKKSELVQIIESVVRECIKERREQFQQQTSEAGLTSEKADDQISPLEDIIRAVIQSGVKGKEEIIKKAHELYKNQMNQHDVDDLAEASYKVVAPHSVDTAKEDKARSIQTDPKVNETSYKVASPNAVDTSKEDKARKIQTEPKVNETAYKVQGPSAKTFKNSPQFPEAVNDPKNR